MLRKSSAVLGWLVLMGTTSFVGAQSGPVERLEQWHHWRGPEANGTAPRANPPVHWDSTKNVRWKAPLPGRGSATPIVWDDQVFIVTAIATDKTARDEDLPKADPSLARKTTA